MGGNGNQKAIMEIKEAFVKRGMDFLGQIRISGKDLKFGAYINMTKDFAKIFQECNLK